MLATAKGRISKTETEAFVKTIDKLALMTARRRRTHPCWEAVKNLVQATGNWKKAPRGKPGILAQSSVCTSAYLNGDGPEGVSGSGWSGGREEFP